MMDITKQKDPTRETYEKIAWSYDGKYPGSIMKNQLADFMRYCPKGKILDIGCGTGRDAEHFARKGYSVIGIDYSSQMLEVARAKLPFIKFIKMDMRVMDVKSDTFDGIWCCASFHHVTKLDAPEVLNQFHMALKDQGLLFLTVKKGNREGFVELEGGSRFFANYQGKELEELLRGRNFEILESYENSGGSSTEWINIFCRARK